MRLTHRQKWFSTMLMGSIFLLVSSDLHSQTNEATTKGSLILTAEKQQPSIGPEIQRQLRTDAVSIRSPISKNDRLGYQIETLGTNFDGFDFDNNSTENSGFLFIPPDPIGAAGIDRLVAVVNTMIEARDKTGALLWRDALQDFFIDLAPANALFDPKVVYDHYEDRFVIVALERVHAGSNPDPGNSSRILVAVSQSGAPVSATNTDWHYHEINAEESIDGSDHWVDYPGFEVDEEAVYITGSMFAHTGGSTTFSVRLWIIDKGVSGGFYDNNFAIVTKHDLYDGYGIAITTMPALIYGSGGAGLDIGTYLVSFSGLTGGGFEFIQVVRVDDPLSSPTFNHEYVNIGDIDNLSSELPDAPQSGTSTLVEVNDRRALDAVWRNDRLWLTTTISPNSGPSAGETTAHWVKLNTSAIPGGSITYDDQGNIGGEDIDVGGEVYTFFPSLAVNDAGDAYFGFSASGASIYPGAYCAGRKAGDSPGTVRATEIVRAGVDYYIRTFGGSRNRWGDYSGASLDPTDDNLFWIFNEYATTQGTPTNPPLEYGRWGTTWASVSFVQTIFTNGADAGLSFSQSSPTPPLNDWPLGQFSLSSSATGATLDAVTVILSGSYANLNGPNPFRLFAANANNFATATGIGTNTAASGGIVTFSSLADILPAGNRYFWVTVDIAIGAEGTINGTIADVSAPDISDASISYSSAWGQLNVGNDVSLPVQLSAFTARGSDEQILLDWITQSETNNLGFIIRRSVTLDGPFSEIASFHDREELKGQGSSANATNYRFSDDRIENDLTYYYYLIDVDYGGVQTVHGPVNATATGADLVTLQFQLDQNYPNPFNPITAISWLLAVDSEVELNIYNLLGQKVATLVSGRQPAGKYRMEWDATGFSSGIYYYKIETSEFNQMRKMILLK